MQREAYITLIGGGMVGFTASLFCALWVVEVVEALFESSPVGLQQRFEPSLFCFVLFVDAAVPIKRSAKSKDGLLSKLILYNLSRQGLV